MGIDLNKPIIYKHASLRFFNEGERHIDRICQENVLLLVYEGVLRFSENGVLREIAAGEYYIQKRGISQTGVLPSDSPKYLYVHFLATWSSGTESLPTRGRFSYTSLKEKMNSLNDLSHGSSTLTEQTAEFYAIISALYSSTKDTGIAAQVAQYLNEHFAEKITLSGLADTFHFSKNHIISVFADKYKMAPFEYLGHIRIQNSKKLLEISSDSAESIARESGFNDYSNFYRLFYKYNSVSPMKWRSLCRQSSAIPR